MLFLLFLLFLDLGARGCSCLPREPAHKNGKLRCPDPEKAKKAKKALPVSVFSLIIAKKATKALPVSVFSLSIAKKGKIPVIVFSLTGWVVVVVVVVVVVDQSSNAYHGFLLHSIIATKLYSPHLKTQGDPSELSFTSGPVLLLASARCPALGFVSIATAIAEPDAKRSASLERQDPSRSSPSKLTSRPK